MTEEHWVAWAWRRERVLACATVSTSDAAREEKRAATMGRERGKETAALMDGKKDSVEVVC